MNFRTATEEDFDTVAKDSISRDFFADRPKDIDHVYALEHDGKLLGIGGIKVLNPWTAWAWFDLSSAALGYKTIVFRIIKTHMDELMAKLNIQRLMAAVEVGFEAAVRTAEHLGFQRESYMPKFMGDKDAYMYVRYGGA